ncbi:MAG TPA: thioredoxin family protein, partial [Gaiellaceae bacterium]|nr:thioredoxin family protein [Gaiellaceae bacterium]
ATNGRRPQLVFFTSTRSGRARRVEGYLAAVLQRRGNHDTFELVQVDIDGFPEIAERLGVDSVPVLMVIDEGSVQARLENPPGAAAISDALEPWLK